ncbi:nucleotidyltransferase family protein [Peribacillus simplex]|uniref:nucleotidyltransferase domain-containing protein n=1 Tax=Peribacillus simplex TaxID=1478 RepID=UPI0011A39795|nr:nucleotidyltransferase family protein [Peribacillus simplex]
MDNNFILDLSIIPKELRLLLEIMKTENDDSIEASIKELISESDWESFLQLAMHHRVYPIIYTKLIKIDKRLIPKNVIQTLYQEYQKNTFQMLYLSGEMEQVSKLFTENQIRLLFLKGPVIAADLYGDISLRTSKDLDILIPIDSLEKAEELLLSIGYEKEVVPNILNEWKWRHHHVVYYHPKKNIQLEIHWRLQPCPLKEPKFNELWERKRLGTITSYPVYFLGKYDLFLYLVSHGARHGWFRLRWLLDIDQMIRKGLELEEINRLNDKYQNRHIVGQALILASELIKTPIEGDLIKLTEGSYSKKFAQNTVYFIKENESLTNIMSNKYYKRYRFSLMSSLQKFFYSMILFYPSSLDAKTLKLPKSLHFLYFPLRPLLWAWRKTKNIKNSS